MPSEGWDCLVPFIAMTVFQIPSANSTCAFNALSDGSSRSFAFSRITPASRASSIPRRPNVGSAARARRHNIRAPHTRVEIHVASGSVDFLANFALLTV